MIQSIGGEDLRASPESFRFRIDLLHFVVIIYIIKYGEVQRVNLREEMRFNLYIYEYKAI